MLLFRPKRGPVLTRGRLAHFVVGAAVPAAAYRIGGYNALGWASGAVLLGAVAWEMVTPALAGPMGWVHKWGDVVDLAAFAAGVVSVGLWLGR